MNGQNPPVRMGTMQSFVNFTATHVGTKILQHVSFLMGELHFIKHICVCEIVSAKRDLNYICKRHVFSTFHLFRHFRSLKCPLHVASYD